MRDLSMLGARTEATCKNFGQTKPASEFYSSILATRTNPTCKACRNAMEKTREAGVTVKKPAKSRETPPPSPPALLQPMTAAPTTPAPLCLVVGTYIIPLSAIAGIIVDERGEAEVTMSVQETRVRDGMIAPMAWAFNATEWAARSIMPFADAIGGGVSIANLQREIATLSDALRSAQRETAAATARAAATEKAAEDARAMATQILQTFTRRAA